MGESVAFPTRAQQLLLRAALADGATAADAWVAWRARTEVDTLDSDSQWLLPRLFQNLHRLGVPPGQTARYRNVYRHHWYRNQLMLRQAEAVVDVGVSPMDAGIIIGGAAMALRDHEAIGVRPFAHVDVLASVRTRDRPHDGQTTDVPIRVRTALFGPGGDADVFARATTVGWRNRRWRVLHAADQLVDICVRRHDWDTRSALFWIADAVSLIRRRSSLDWTVVDEFARRIGQQEQVAEALATIAAIDECWMRLMPSRLRPRSAALPARPAS